jgi:hypothetical protein
MQPLMGAPRSKSVPIHSGDNGVETQTPSLDGRITGRTRTCWFETLQYDGLEVRYGATNAPSSYAHTPCLRLRKIVLRRHPNAQFGIRGGKRQACWLAQSEEWSFLRKDLAYLFPKLIQRERLVEEIYAGIQHAVMHHRIARVAGSEQYLQVRA